MISSRESGLELKRQLRAHQKRYCPLGNYLLPSGLVTKYLKPVLESAGPADAAGAFTILSDSCSKPGNPVFLNGPLAVSLG